MFIERRKRDFMTGYIARKVMYNERVLPLMLKALTVKEDAFNGYSIMPFYFSANTFDHIKKPKGG